MKLRCECGDPPRSARERQLLLPFLPSLKRRGKALGKHGFYDPVQTLDFHFLWRKVC